MTTILISGFEPFDGYSVNPSAEVSKSLQGKSIEGAKIVSVVLPLDYENALDVFHGSIETHKPDYILCFGQSNRPAITIERIGINILNPNREDNYGNKPQSDIIDEALEAAHFSNIDPHPLVSILRENLIPANVSYHAGTYGCNWLLFNVMDWISKGMMQAKATFIHLPPLPIQAIEKDNYSLPTMPLGMQLNAARLLVTHLLESDA